MTTSSPETAGGARGFDPGAEVPLDAARLSALATRLYAELSGVTAAVPRPPDTVPRPDPATVSGTGPAPFDPPAWPGEPFGIGALPVPDVSALLLDAGAGHPSWQPTEPDPFALGDVPGPGIAPPVAPPVPGERREVFDVASIRDDFPILSERVNGHRLVWLDNAATTQKPRQVIDRISHFYRHENSNIHRAAHELAARATGAYEDARETVRRFIGAGSTEEIVFLRGTTEAINLVAQSWGGAHLGAGDEIVITHLEHHANIVPWQQLAKRTGAVLRVAPVDDTGTLDLAAFEALLGPRTRIVSATHVSNALGTVNPVREIVELGHRHGARVLIDAAQSVPHVPLDVRQLGADFLVFSGHKIFGPTGIGVLYGTEEALAETPPWQGGGNMIADVTLERTIFNGPPNRFEAGTGNIADAVGLGEALRYVESIGIERIAGHEHELLEHATPRLAAVPGVRLVGTAQHKASVLSFVLNGHDTIRVGQRLNEFGIAVRAGHHCAQPILRRLGLEATVRPSFAFTNTFEEADRLVEAVEWIARHPE
ncbi:cysteine desulfurase [Leucobacter weissii]|uniref:cysteine desulfurase n=1 Tax=Leucobacter weissii TaxID=1983706 RepID=A0A939MPM4_9MICO|nr:family 2A encapsulin nanocompartment cargo protein cysteine desulfurase [Leucobacter weissii]MBO1900739.1 cysteine desulfurase [Leucobacter weissii]